MKKPLFLFFLFATLCTALAGFNQTTFAVSTYSQTSAVEYLAGHQTNPWVTMALAAAGAANIQTDYLKSIEGSKAIDFEAPILAITAAGKNPRTFAATDYVAKLESFDNGGQIGDPATVNDDIFGLLALYSAGDGSSQAATDAKKYLIAHQNSDGGWGFSAGGASDSNTTAAAILALVASGANQSDSAIQNAFAYIKSAQNSDGGFTYDPKSQYGTGSDSSSTAWVIWAMNAAGIAPAAWSRSENTPLSYLSGNQDTSGFFKFDSSSSEDSFSPVTTSYAVIALTGKTLPVGIVNTTAQSNSGTGGNSSSQAATYAYRIQGSSGQLCSGQLPAATAMDIIKNAAGICGFSYHITNTSYGPYVDTVGSDSAAGTQGWVFLVNNSAPNVGAADYQLKNGDSVLWYYGDFTWKPTRLTLTAAKIASGGQAQIHVEGLSGGWTPLAGATVLYGANQTVTDANGNAVISPPDGYYQIYAKKELFITSNTALLQAGQANSSSVSMSANLQLGDVAGTSTTQTVSFSINPSILDFGNLSAGQSASKTLTISNTGSEPIFIQALVSGDDAFVNGLLLDKILWNGYSLNQPAGSAKPVTATLSIPKGLTGPTHQASGSIIFWAVPQ